MTGDVAAADTAWDEVIVNRATRAGFACLDRVDLVSLFQLRASVMKSPPKFLRGAYRSAIRVALTEADLGYAARDELRVTRSWKFLLLLQNASPQTSSWQFDPQRQAILAQAILAQAIFLQAFLLLARRKQVSFRFFCSQVRRTGMVRRGWHTSEWSKQWVQVLRGPRPPAAKWPRVQRQSPSNVPDSSRVGLPNTGVRPQTKVTDRVPRRNPEENCAAAQATVRRLEVALAALEESDVAAREAIQASLVKARVAARVLPVSDRITECRSFIERAERRVTKAEEAVQAAVSWKKQMEAEVEEGRARLRRLEEELDVEAVPVPTTSEVERLQALVAQLQSQLHQVAPATLAAPLDSRSEVPVAKRCRREDFVPHCDEEMQEWMQARQADLQAAVVTGQLQEVSRISQLLTTAAQEWQELMIQNRRTAPSMLANTAR